MEIAYPEKLSEADIQARLWQKLKSVGLDTFLEITNKQGRHYRLDIVIFKNKKAICIIECKNWSKEYIRTYKYQGARNTGQIKKYRALFQIPVFICGCVSAIEPLTKIILNIYRQAK